MKASTVLIEARRKAGLTQQQLAEKAGSVQSMISKIERGETRPSLETLDRLLRACGYALYVRRHIGEGVDRTVIRDLRSADPKRRLAAAEEKAEYFAGVRPERFGGGALFDAVEVLAKHGVRFVVIGGVAAILHGLHRVTYDVDVCYAPDRENLKRLGKALLELEAYPRGWPAGLPWKPNTKTLDSQLVHTLKTKSGPLDCLGAPAGTDGYASLEASAVAMTVGTIRVKVASVNDLIRMKLAAARPQDIADAERLGALLDEINDEPEMPWTPPAE